MEKELDPSIIKSTQSSLGKYVKRPPLSDKLLKKPPFRFLHDIITTVLKTTGFFEGLFEEDELVSDNVKDRESKINFLNKVISIVGLANGKTLSVKSSKIVAGQEPDKTNELLQCLAQVLDQKISSDEFVKKYKEGAKPSQTIEPKAKESTKPIKKNIETKKLTSRSNEKLTTQKKEQKDGPTVKNGAKERVSRSKDRENSTIKQESPPKPSIQKSKVLVKKASVENANQQHDGNSQTNKKLSKVSSRDSTKSLYDKDENLIINGKESSDSVLKAAEARPVQEPETDELVKEKLDTSYTIADTDLNSSSSSQDLLETRNKFEEPQENKLKTPPFPEIISTEEEHIQENKEENVSEIAEQKHDEIGVNKVDNNISNFRQNSKETVEKNNDRLASANKNGAVSNQPVRPTSVRPSSSRPGAPRLRDKHGGTAQASDNLLVGKVNIITENTPNEEEEDTSIIIVDQPIDNKSIEQPDQLSSNHHGHLVQQILDSQKEFSQATGKTEIEWQFGAQKAREASNQEIEQVRFNILAVSRAANPLGKLLDHIQEDVEVMRQELQQWTRTYEETSKELSKQKTANDDSLLPLHTKIKQLDADLKEKQDKINDLKIVIHKNSSRIDKLLASGSVQ